PEVVAWMMLLRTEPAGAAAPAELTKRPVWAPQPGHGPYSRVLFSIVGESTSGPLPFSKRTTTLAPGHEPLRSRLLVTREALSCRRNATSVSEAEAVLSHDGPSITFASSVGEAPSTSTLIPSLGL